MRSSLAFVVASVGGFAGCGGCDPCDPEGSVELDYDDDESWVCRGDDCPDLDLTATEIREDGSSVTVEHAADEPVGDLACFYVYPTMDLRLVAGLHREFDDLGSMELVVATQAARFSEVCTVHAPLYRQVTLGTYAKNSRSENQACFDVAFSDVARAFGQFLEDVPDRPLLVFGHSQGAQHVSRLVRETIESDDALLARLVAVFPIGWPLGTAKDDVVGGSFARVPVCEAREQTGCAVGFRSFGAGNAPSSNATAFLEGDAPVCVDPSRQNTLSRSYFGTERPLITVPDDVDTPFVLYRDRFSARCVEQGRELGLEVGVLAGDARENPVDFDKGSLSGEVGTHVLDVQLTLGDLIDLAGDKARAFVR